MSVFAGENVATLKMNKLIMMKQLGNGLRCSKRLDVWENWWPKQSCKVLQISISLSLFGWSRMRSVRSAQEKNSQSCKAEPSRLIKWDNNQSAWSFSYPLDGMPRGARWDDARPRSQELSCSIWAVLSSNLFTTQEADWTSHSQLLRIIVHYHNAVHV